MTRSQVQYTSNCIFPLPLTEITHAGDPFATVLLADWQSGYLHVIEQMYPT